MAIALVKGKFAGEKAKKSRLKAGWLRAFHNYADCP
jgi:hypothetical protein